jgi:glycosyltransferase involved in cell wall biosynthesis
MRIQIITSSYPIKPDDPSGAAGLFVRDFARQLVSDGHYVVVQPVARKEQYVADEGIIIEPIPWLGGDQELASLSFVNIRNLWFILNFFWLGFSAVVDTAKKHKTERVLAMWVIPSGLFAYMIRRKLGIRYDVWALGSDIWRIRKIPVFGPWIIRRAINKATRVMADGIQLCRDVEYLTHRNCEFLPSCRKMPVIAKNQANADAVIKLLFVGRYHVNKGPDILIEAIALLDPEKKKNIHLDIYGLGPLGPQLQSEIQSKGLGDCISLHGTITVTELAERFIDTDFLVIPSRIESIPVVFSDAIQSGVPVITMPVGDLPDLIERFKCGICAATVSADSFAAAIEMAIVKGKEEFRSGIKLTQKHFDIEISAKNWLHELPYGHL